jgi:hypothetical protein
MVKKQYVFNKNCEMGNKILGRNSGRLWKKMSFGVPEKFVLLTLIFV